MFFIPIYLLAAVALWARHWMGLVLALVASGGVVYVMIYLQALAGLSGAVNVVADGLFLVCALATVWQVGGRIRLAQMCRHAR
jgi:hypothetical protein